MIIEEVYKKVDKYLASDSYLPMIVDLPSANYLSEFKTHYRVGQNRFIGSNTYATKDNLPDIPKLLDAVSHFEGITFITGISAALKLRGAQETKRFFKKFMAVEAQGKLVLISIQCADYLKFSDPRIAASNRVLIVTSDENAAISSMSFISKNLHDSFPVFTDGIGMAVEMYDEFTGKVLNVVTSKTKKDFPLSLIPIKEFNSTYHTIVVTYNELNGLEEQWGDETLWGYLYKTLKKNTSWDALVLKEFAGVPNLTNCFSQYSTFSQDKKWEHFIAIKVCGAKGNEYLSYVISKTNGYAEFIPNLYNLILDFEISDKHFLSLYNERRSILQYVKDEHLSSEFCKLAGGHSENALYYLTDDTSAEKRMILSTIAKYPEIFTIDKLPEKLKVVSPSLYAYLRNVNFREDLFTRYFAQYKYCKVTNRISEVMREMVNEQAIKREYNKYLVPRASIVSKLQKEKAIVYFVDALGVEFLGFIQDELYGRQLIGKIQYGLSNLPSITCMNREFVSEFQSADVPVRDIKKIDEIKHDGVLSCDYETEKLPVHLFAELEEIRNVLKRAEMDLTSGHFKRVYLISDHGASRLAVINEQENKWEVKEKGQHSGRCCPKPEISEKPEQATEENNFWCLANYDRFRGGRKANVEVHGGATLEEVVVPIIEITQQPASLKCAIDTKSKVVTTSFKKNAIVRIYISEDFDNVKVLVEGIYYEAQKSENKYYYTVEMPEVKKSGIHSMDVYVNNSIIAQGLTFEVKKEGANERKFF